MKKIAIVTGSSGLIGSESVKFFVEHGYLVLGIDNDMRKYFFGDEGSTKPSEENLIKTLKTDYIHFDLDIRNYSALENIFKNYQSNIKIVIHTAAQPSHDWASKEPMTDLQYKCGRYFEFIGTNQTLLSRIDLHIHLDK